MKETLASRARKRQARVTCFYHPRRPPPPIRFFQAPLHVHGRDAPESASLSLAPRLRQLGLARALMACISVRSPAISLRTPPHSAAKPANNPMASHKKPISMATKIVNVGESSSRAFLDSPNQPSFRNRRNRAAIPQFFAPLRLRAIASNFPKPPPARPTSAPRPPRKSRFGLARPTPR